MSTPTDEQKRTQSVKLGVAELRTEEEAGHFGLYRPVYVDAWDDGKGEFIRLSTDKPLGPLAVFREARGDDPVHMRSFHPTEKRLMALTCVWDPSRNFLRGQEG